MSAHRLAQHFEDRTILPVRLDEVRDAVLAYGLCDRLTFKPVVLEGGILLGVCYHYRFRPAVYAEPETRVDILYADNLDLASRRLVVCKELIHVLDNGAHSVAQAAEVDELIRRMSRRPELRESVFLGERSDRFALLQALGILFPFAARSLIKPAYDEGKISDEMIARRAGIPEEFVDYLMSDDWEKDYDGIMRMCERDKAA
jgi:hypothetical protein